MLSSARAFARASARRQRLGSRRFINGPDAQSALISATVGLIAAAEVASAVNIAEADHVCEITFPLKSGEGSGFPPLTFYRRPGERQTEGSERLHMGMRNPDHGDPSS